MNLHTIHKIDNDWADQISPQDRLQLVVDDLQTMFAAIQGQMVEFSKLIIQLKHGPMTNIRQFRYTIQLPDGSVLQCTVDAPSMEIALQMAEGYALDFSQYAAITKIMEEKR